MVKSAERVSPLDAITLPRAVNGELGVELSERICESLVQIQAWPNTVAAVEKAIQKTARTDTVILPTGPGRWLVEDESLDLEVRLRKAVPADRGAVTGLTHGRVVVAIAGPKAEWVLASGIALDFDQKAFPVGTTQVSHHHEIGVTIHRTGDQSFDLYVFTSLARSFWRWIERAGEEVGLSVG